MTAAVEAQRLVKHFGGRGGTVEAVRGVDLSVSKGEVFGFLGPSGAGKSTTQNVLIRCSTATRPDSRLGARSSRLGP